MALSALQQHAQDVRRAAETALGATLAATGASLDKALRCEESALNVVETVGAGRWTAIAAQLAQGNGGELKPTGGHKPKFCSAFSSCALAVNTFGPFDATNDLPLPGIEAFRGGVEFEAQRSAGVRGYKPNLDLIAEPAAGDWLFAESKCLEYLRPHRTPFSDAFVSKAINVLSPETAAVYADFAHHHATGAHGYELLDAAQLLKHFLAAKLASGSGHKVMLAYLYWEPADAADHEAFAAHRDVWAHWDQLNDAELAAHAAAVRTRYDVTLGPFA